MLRHLITGKYLSWDGTVDEMNLDLSPSLSEFVK